jgi:hypothetical protein
MEYVQVIIGTERGTEKPVYDKQPEFVDLLSGMELNSYP